MSSDSDLTPQQMTTPKKPYRQILLEEISEGRHELHRPLLGLLISSLSAGLDVGFSLFMIAVMKTRVGAEFPAAVTAILTANMYALGFVFVTLGRSELFTEHTTLAVLPVLGRHASLWALARLWFVVFAGNIAGTAAFAALTVLIGPMLGIIEPRVLGEVAQNVISHSGKALLLSGLLAGWLMGLLTWLVTASRDTISQIAFVWIITTVIGFAQLHHAIVGSVEVLAGIIAGQGVTLGDYGFFLGWTTLGNALGGVFFVALLKFSHASIRHPEDGEESTENHQEQTNQQSGPSEEAPRGRRAS
jgi:formate/nitrite transporter FocA (FNT family)